MSFISQVLSYLLKIISFFFPVNHSLNIIFRYSFYFVFFLNFQFITYKKAGKILRIFLHLLLLVLAIATYFIIHTLEANFDFRKYFHIAAMSSGCRYELKGRIRGRAECGYTVYLLSLCWSTQLFLYILLLCQKWREEKRFQQFQ